MPTKMLSKVESPKSPSPDELYDLALRQSVFHNRYKRWAQAFTAHARPGGDLNVMQIYVLFLIRTEGAMPSTLARRLMVTPTVITGVVDRLERRGYLRREDDRVDRRRVHLVLTPDGERVSLAAERTTFTHVADHMADFSAKDLADISRAFDLMEDVLGHLEHGVKASGENHIEEQIA
jgi:DNA-binding MarR family transcriptional regulator